MRALLLVLFFLISVFAFADKLTLVNGDRVTGKFVDMVDGKLTFDSQVMGRVNVNWSNVSNLETDDTVRITLANGEEFEARILSGGANGLYVRIDGDSQPIAWLELSGINLPLPLVAPTKWDGALSSSLGLTDSNRDAQNFNLDFDITRVRATDRLSAKAAYAFANQSLSGGGSETTVDSWFTRGQYDAIVSDTFFWYGSLRFDRDRISDLDLRTAIGAGGGYTLWNTENSQFRSTFGLSYLREDFTAGEANSLVSLQFGTGLKHEFNSWLTILHDTSFFPNPSDISDYFFASELILRSAVATNMFAELKFVFDYDTTPAPGAQQGNYRYTMGVGMRF